MSVSKKFLNLFFIIQIPLYLKKVPSLIFPSINEGGWYEWLGSKESISKYKKDNKIKIQNPIELTNVE